MAARPAVSAREQGGGWQRDRRSRREEQLDPRGGEPVGASWGVVGAGVGPWGQCGAVGTVGGLGAVGGMGASRGLGMWCYPQVELAGDADLIVGGVTGTLGTCGGGGGGLQQREGPAWRGRWGVEDPAGPGRD